MTNPSQSKKMVIFLGGTGRSGTTLLANLLGRHPRIAAFGEMKLIDFPQFREFPSKIKKQPLVGRKRLVQQFKDFFLKQMFQFEVQFKVSKSPKRGPGTQVPADYAKSCLDILDNMAGLESPDDIDRCYGRFIDALFSFFPKKQNKEVWAEKTPHNCEYGHLLYRWFMHDYDFKIIDIVRDGRDVACSVAPLPWGPNTKMEGLDWWAFGLCRITEAFEKIPQSKWIRIRYEDLLVNSRTVQRLVLKFLNMPESTAVYNYPIHSKSMGRWKSEMAEEEKQYAEKNYGRLLKALGYEI